MVHTLPHNQYTFENVTFDGLVKIGDEVVCTRNGTVNDTVKIVSVESERFKCNNGVSEYLIYLNTDCPWRMVFVCYKVKQRTMLVEIYNKDY